MGWNGKIAKFKKFEVETKKQKLTEIEKKQHTSKMGKSRDLRLDEQVDEMYIYIFETGGKSLARLSQESQNLSKLTSPSTTEDFALSFENNF